MSSNLAVKWSPNRDPEAVREIVRLAEVQLEDGLAMALGADQRAITQASVLAVIAAALFAAATNMVHIQNNDHTPFITLLISSAGLLLAAWTSMHAARPVDYYPRGFQPIKLAACAHDPGQLHEWVAEDLQRRISANREILNRTSDLTIRGQRIAVAAIAIPIALLLFFQLPG